MAIMIFCGIDMPRVGCTILVVATIVGAGMLAEGVTKEKKAMQAIKLSLLNGIEACFEIRVSSEGHDTNASISKVSDSD